MTEAVMKSEAFSGWAIVELMGHRIRAGEVKEVEMAGAKMLRVDIHCDDDAVLTEYYSPSALYSLRPCSEEIAKAEMAAYRDPRPVRPVEYREETRKRLSHDSYEFIDDDAH